MKKYIIRKRGTDWYLIDARPLVSDAKGAGVTEFDWGNLTNARTFESKEAACAFFEGTTDPALSQLLPQVDVEEVDWTPSATPDSAAKQCINCKYFRQTGVHSGNCTWHYENPTPLWLQRELPVRQMQKRDGHFCSVFEEGGGE